MLTALILTAGIAIILVAGLSAALGFSAKENQRLSATHTIDQHKIGSLHQRLEKLREATENKHTEKADFERELEVARVQLSSAERLNKDLNTALSSAQTDNSACAQHLIQERGRVAYWRTQCEAAREQLKQQTAPQA